ncbi:cupin domain-containing protein [Rubrobacter marinus]|uniref:Cupin domain-containing protein n=1 Tax=Rubrobacter marinus TaxID=2653852 RepID=A0A6G8PWJ4_9ACTN|nr:cupin domain-containing protein [Rubrobacter marinus]QIN78584.1 cupin domain-containing protein [Rubrobacter marinus]
MREADPVDLHESLAAGSGAGAVWTLEGSRDLNANLVRFPAGGGVDEHVNEEVDVLVVGVAGVGRVAVDGRAFPLRSGVVVFVPRGARRSTRSESADFAYLTVHRRRGPLRVAGTDGDP